MNTEKPYGDFTAEYQCSQFKMSQYSQNTTEKEIKFINHYYCCVLQEFFLINQFCYFDPVQNHTCRDSTGRAHNVRDAIKKRAIEPQSYYLQQYFI